MKPQTETFLGKARSLIEQMNTMFSVGLYDAAGRTAYLAGFHAAQALLFERTGQIFKSHQGIHAEFARLVKDMPEFDAAMRAFLGRTYNLKAIADYEAGPDATITGDRAVEAGRAAVEFVNRIEHFLTKSPQTQ